MSVNIDPSILSSLKALTSNTNSSGSDTEKLIKNMLSIFSKTSSGSTEKEIPDYLSGVGMSATEHMAMEDDSGDDAFWAYIDAKAEAARNMNSGSGTLGQLMQMLKQYLSANNDK